MYNHKIRYLITYIHIYIYIYIYIYISGLQREGRDVEAGDHEPGRQDRAAVLSEAHD